MKVEQYISKIWIIVLANLKNHGIYYINSVLLDLNEIEALTIHKSRVIYVS